MVPAVQDKQAWAGEAVGVVVQDAENYKDIAEVAVPRAGIVRADYSRSYHQHSQETGSSHSSGGTVEDMFATPAVDTASPAGVG